MTNATIPDEKSLRRLLRRAVAEIIPEEEFASALRSGRRLRLKMGLDPSAPDLTVGHAVALRKMRQLQELGHQVVLIVGDWTARIGDPSGQSQTRRMLTAEEVKANAETYLRQFYKVVDESRTEIRFQSEWYDKFDLETVIRLTARFTVAQMLQRDDYSQRFAEHKPIGIHEFLYPLLQAYDSVAIKADVEFGGTDQKFNLLVGRELQQMMGQPPQQCFLVPLLVGTDGKVKMSKSLGNYIALEDPPDEMYGKTMSLPDAVIMDYFELVTNVPDEELAEMQEALRTRSENPMKFKMRLAFETVKQFHGEPAAVAAEISFDQAYRQRRFPEKMPTLALRFSEYNRLRPPIGAEHGDAPGPGGPTVVVFRDSRGKQLAAGLSEPWTVPGDRLSHGPEPGPSIAVNLVKLLFGCQLVPSLSEARRLLSSGAVDVDGVTVKEPEARLLQWSIVKAGKTRFLMVEDLDRLSQLGQVLQEALRDGKQGAAGPSGVQG
jgi:tyrosyl-tRNA synthetase